MSNRMKTFCVACAVALMGATAFAKLPAPSDEAKAKAAQAKAKADWSGKVAAYKLCQAQDQVVAHYKKAPEPKAVKAPAKGAAPAATPAGSCADPGPFVYTPNQAVAPVAAASAAPAAVAAAKKP
ncbi:hypothetical protein [Rhodoferax sp.]|uniref:hypothetical protein n=1 Tax=Rhodoferax sp. TaxID=50421 RepID=UPI002601B6DF|nr:hypothetical protein [Rhodoferax sp.]MDD2660976.1 hypothetical protein [Methylococcales bacterium]MDD5479777.1 hypothetical protein [Rhodoferax sp.]